MPSFQHDIIVELFRSRGELAAELLQACGVAVAHARVELGSVDLPPALLHPGSDRRRAPDSASVTASPRA